MQGYRLKCRNQKCGGEFHRYYGSAEFDRLQYGTVPGIGCFQCGFSKMLVMKSSALVKDGFQPGFQRNIRKHCATYSEYKAHLKNLGLVELGYEDIPEFKGIKTQYFDDAMMRKIHKKHNISLSGREADHLQGKI